MDFKVTPIEGKTFPKVTAVPSDEYGAFVITIPHEGRRAVGEIELEALGLSRRGRAMQDDFSGVRELIEADALRPGFYRLSVGIGRVSIAVRGDQLSYPIQEFQELNPSLPTQE